MELSVAINDHVAPTVTVSSQYIHAHVPTSERQEESKYYISFWGREI